MSPAALSRLGGALYLIVIVGGIFCELVARGGLVVAGNAVATAAHLRSSEALWRAGIAVELFSCGATVVLAWVFYVLLRPVSRDLALLMVFFDLIGIGLGAAFALNLVAALFPLGPAAYLHAFRPEQLDALATLSIQSHAFGFGISLLFFGLTFPVRGFLLFRSGFLPKALGVLVTIAGLGYITNAFALTLAPAVADRIFPIVALPIFVGEASVCLWLLLRGVDSERWFARALRA